jgi:SPW repeat-containing protein
MAWISWLNVALGLWLVVAGFVLPHVTGAGVTEDVVAGLILALAALWAARAFRPLMSVVASWTVTLSGVWIVAAPFVLHYRDHRAAFADDVIVGLAIVALGTANMLAKDHRLRPSRAEAHGLHSRVDR